MSKISLAPDANGTGIFTIASPNSNTNRTLTLPDDTGTIVTNSGNQAGSFTTLNTSGQVVFNDAGADVDFRVEGDTDANLLFVDAGNDRVGIGTASGLDAKLNVVRNTNGSIGTAANAVANFQGAASPYNLYVSFDTSVASIWHNSAGRGLAFGTGDTERMRIDSFGNLFVGTNSLGTVGSVVGAGLYTNGFVAGSADGAAVAYFARKTSDGDIAVFRKDTTTIGLIGSTSGTMYIKGNTGTTQIGTGTTFFRVIDSDATAVPRIIPSTDNLADLGDGTYRYDDIYATNAIIQTSDRNEKQDIEELTEAETRVAVAAKALMRKYRWKSAVAEKGDDARIHFGIIAQDLQAAFEAEGLDAGRYAMFIHSAWWEKERVIPAVEAKEAVYETHTDEEGNETQVLVSEAVEAQPERTVIDTFESEEEAGEGAVRKERMGIRYNELLAFIIAAI